MDFFNLVLSRFLELPGEIQAILVLGGASVLTCCLVELSFAIEEWRQEEYLYRTGIFTWAVGYWDLDVGFPCGGGWESLKKFHGYGAKRRARKYRERHRKTLQRQ